MGFFDFLKPKKNPLDDPKFRPLMIKGMADQLATRCENLKAVGRETEARAVAVKFVMDSFRTCAQKEYLESAEMLSAATYSAIRLGEANLGKQLLDSIIETHEAVRVKNPKSSSAVMDLTQPYIDAGRLAHRIPNSSDEEYRCFWLAAAAQPPACCKEPASNRQKAMAHQFAYGTLCTSPTMMKKMSDWKKRMEWHDAKRREYAPECDWDDPMAMIAWVKEDNSKE